MGAWGSGPFDNDAAADWGQDLEDADDLTLAVDALARVSTDAYVEADEAAVAIAAAEVIAAVGGRPRSELPPEVTAWIARSSLVLDAEHAEAATAAVERVRAAESELAELWDEAEDSRWRDDLDDLAERLGR